MDNKSTVTIIIDTKGGDVVEYDKIVALIKEMGLSHKINIVSTSGIDDQKQLIEYEIHAKQKSRDEQLKQWGCAFILAVVLILILAIIYARSQTGS